MQVRHVMQGEHAEDEVIAAGPVDLVQVRLPVGDVRPRPACRRPLDHRPGQVNGVDVPEPGGEQHRMPPGSAAEVERPAARHGQEAVQPRAAQLDPAQFAQPVVARRDPVEGLRFYPAHRCSPHGKKQ
jgi:hypothetical protein